MKKIIETCARCGCMPNVFPNAVYCNTVTHGYNDEQELCDGRTFPDVDAWNKQQHYSKFHAQCTVDVRELVSRKVQVNVTTGGE